MRTTSKALVTGGAGFIGSHIVDELLKRGIETCVIDSLRTGSLDNLRQHRESKLLRIFVCDLRKIDSLSEQIGEVDVVFHEAAIASVPESITHPTTVYRTNVDSTMKLMNFCLKKKVKRFVFASSAAVYGRIKNPPASEDDLCAPSTPYGASKLSVEIYLNAYHATYGLETVNLRYFNVYGPRQRMNDDYSGVITIFAKRLIQCQVPTIFGDGKQTRDFVCVADIVQANMLAMESRAAAGKTFNVASGNSVSILELVESLKSITGASEVNPRFAPPRPGDLRVGTASISKISTELGYIPTTSLSRGLAALVEDMRRKTGEVLMAS